MSSVHNNPQLTEGLLEQCLNLLAKERIQGLDEQKLTGLSEEAFIRQAGGFPARLADMLEERSKGKFTIVEVDAAVVPRPFKRSVYFARYVADMPITEPVVDPQPGMVLCEISPYTTKLIVGMPFNSPEVIQEELERRAEKRAAEAARQEASARHRETVSAEYDRLMERVKFYVERADNERATEKWRQMNSPYNQHRGEIMLQDVIELCALLGLDVATLARH